MRNDVWCLNIYYLQFKRKKKKKIHIEMLLKCQSNIENYSKINFHVMFRVCLIFFSKLK